TAKIDRLLCSWAACHRGLDKSQMVPERMWLDLMRTAVHAGGSLEPGTELRLPPALMRSAIEAAGRAAGKGDVIRFRDEEWLPVVRWAAYRSKDHAVSKLRSWNRAVRCARIADRIQAACAKASGRQWRFTVDGFEYGGLKAIALVSPAALVEEAR
ncbi:MAG TPA: hypothetical protein VNM48_14130, partial [Chloroflexota bacterium]|nr:hypothetical protein [Chloroflexota bacterium]